MSCYQPLSTSQSWADALTECRGLRSDTSTQIAHLAFVMNSSAHQFVQGIVNEVVGD